MDETLSPALWMLVRLLAVGSLACLNLRLIRRRNRAYLALGEPIATPMRFLRNITSALAILAVVALVLNWTDAGWTRWTCSALLIASPLWFWYEARHFERRLEAHAAVERTGD